MKDFLHRLQQLKLAHFFHLMGMSVFFILLLFPILLLAVPDRTYSSAEKRNLTQFPVPSIDSIVDTSYMDTFEEEEIVDIAEVQRNIASIKVELAQVQAQMKKYLEELRL